ncbi:hypothetical protein B296_00026300 [Ensete ventricosum]|uniref:Uncharacterized protein n=1 Tax=Ensete ventricosum TaxID=4639 RepID=A0A426ZPC6_ENSVE|nr:hypothetical protein B296_00026300 [Ensete ventricosum]
MTCFSIGPLGEVRGLGYSGCPRLDWLSDVTIKMPLVNEILDLVLEVVTLLDVMPVIMVETIIPHFVPYLRMHLHQVGVPKDPLFSDLEEDFNPGRVKRYQWRPQSWHFESVQSPPQGPQRLSSRLLYVWVLLVLALLGHHGLSNDILVCPL